MEPLYEAKFDYTLKNLREIVWSIHKKIALGLMAAVGILFFLLELGRGAAAALVFALAAIGIYLVFYILMFFHTTSAAYKKRGKIGYINQYKFYEDKLESYSQGSIVSLEYGKVDGIKENEDYFLLLSNNQALPMAKKDCPKELLDFLRNKIKNA